MEILLPVLLLAACPLMMIWCMRSMRGHGSAEAPDSQQETTRLREEIAALREQINERKVRVASG